MAILIVLGIIGVLLLVLAGYTIKVYNTLVGLKERIPNAKAQIATQIESRFDAVKNLIDSTKKYAKHETETLEKVINQRIGVTENTAMKDVESENDKLNNVVGRLMAISESYPELKANEVYMKAMDGVNEYEDNVRHARMIYNDVVTKFNRVIKMFPSNIIASLFKFKEEEYFEGTEAKQEMPRWD